MLNTYANKYGEVVIRAAATLSPDEAQAFANEILIEASRARKPKTYNIIARRKPDVGSTLVIHIPTATLTSGGLYEGEGTILAGEPRPERDGSYFSIIPTYFDIEVLA